MKKTKSITAKSIIALILVVALLFNVVTPVYAREGNTGSGNTWSAMLLGAYNGAAVSIPSTWSMWAAQLFGQVAMDYADLYYYVNHYSDYGRSVISLNIGGTHINITRGQMVKMVASAAASTVSGYATGQGISVGTAVNNLYNSFTRLVISSAVFQLLVKKFGLDPNLATLASSVITNYVSDHWDLVKRILPQAGTILDELVDPEDKQQEHAQEFLKKLKKGLSNKATKEDKSTTFTKEEMDAGKVLKEKAKNNLEREKEQLNKEWWHIPSARDKRLERIDQEIAALDNFIRELGALAEEINNNPETKDVPYGAPIESARDSLTDGLRSMMDAQKDPVADKLKNGVDKLVGKIGSIIDPSFPEKIEKLRPVTPAAVELKRNSESRVEGGADLSVGKTINLEFNGVPVNCEIKGINDNGSRIISRGTDNRSFVYTQTEGGYTLQAVDIQVNDLISIAKEGETAVTNYTVKSVDSNGRYVLTTGRNSQAFNLVQDSDGGYTIQAANVSGNGTEVEAISHKARIVPQVFRFTGNEASNVDVGSKEGQHILQPSNHAEATLNNIFQSSERVFSKP